MTQECGIRLQRLDSKLKIENLDSVATDEKLGRRRWENVAVLPLQHTHGK